MNLTTKVRICCFSIMICLCILMIASITNNLLYRFRSVPIDTAALSEIEKYEQRFEEKIERIKMNQPNYDEEFYQRVVKILRFYENYPYDLDKNLFKHDSILMNDLISNLESPKRDISNKVVYLDIYNPNAFLFGTFDSVVYTVKFCEMKLQNGEELTEEEERDYANAKKYIEFIRKNFVDYYVLGDVAKVALDAEVELNELISGGSERDLFLAYIGDEEGIVENAIIRKYIILDLYLDFILGVTK